MNSKIIHGSCLDVLRNIQDDSIDCIITSPPYWRMRHYNTRPQVWGGDINCDHINKDTFQEYLKLTTSENSCFKRPWRENASSYIEYSYCKKCGAFIGELGWEKELKDYINHVLIVMRECKRVLKPSGSLWININDRYAGSNPGNSNNNKKPDCVGSAPARDKNVKRKSLFGIPERLIIALIDSGMILRNKIVWQKNNAMAESAADRFTNSYENIFFLVKSESYYFERQYELSLTARDSTYINGHHRRNMRNVWNIQTDTSRKDHYATFPEKICQIALLAACPKDGIVLDPFAGTGTTLVAAKKLGKNYIGIELSDKYYQIATRRLSYISDPLDIVI